MVNVISEWNPTFPPPQLKVFVVRMAKDTPRRLLVSLLDLLTNDECHYILI